MKTVIIIPCYNEEAVLEKNIKEVLEAVKNFLNTIIVISDNNSKDGTAEIAKRLANDNANIEYVFVAEPGKGAAVMEAWKKYEADIYGFMDADLATDLSALPPALSALSEGYDGVIGSRRIGGAKAKRQLYRKFTSFILNFLIRAILKTKVKDTPCGFKFFKKDLINKIVPQVKDRKWVFDTEMLVLAERAGFKIKEIPVEWEEKGLRGSKVNIYPTSREYLKKILEIKHRLS